MSASFKIPILIGPTACGKSEIALRFALTHSAHIISCDSLLVYKDLNIGTAKPSPDELKLVPHHMIDLIQADQTFTAADFVKTTRLLIDELIHKNQPFIIAGGTGFYLKALLFGIWDAPPTQNDFRKKLEDETKDLTLDERNTFLHEKLSVLDSEYAHKINANDHYRVIRALEIIHATGQCLSKTLSQKKLLDPLPYSYEIFGIRRSKIDLERKIIERTNKMFSEGFVSEVRELLKKYPKNLKALQSVGYKEVIDFLDGKMTLDQAKERIVISTRQLAKKQMTFFKTFPDTQWLQLPAEEETLLKKLKISAKG